MLHGADLARHGVAADHDCHAPPAYALEATLPDRAGRFHGVAEDVCVARVWHAGERRVELEEDELVHVPKYVRTPMSADERQGRRDTRGDGKRKTYIISCPSIIMHILFPVPSCIMLRPGEG